MVNKTSLTSPFLSRMWNRVSATAISGLYSTGWSVSSVPDTLNSMPGSAKARAKTTDSLFVVNTLNNVPIKTATNRMTTMFVRLMG